MPYNGYNIHKKNETLPRGEIMREIHTESADIKLIADHYWEVVFRSEVVVTLVEMLKIYRLISTFDLFNPMVLDIRNIGGIEFEALEFTASEDALTNRVQLIVYAHESMSEKYVSLIESLDLGKHDYHIFDTMTEATHWIHENT